MILGQTTGGEPEPLGVTPCGGGVNVAVFSANASAIEFCLFAGDREIRRVRLRGRTGDVFHDHIPGVEPGERYGLRAHGPFLPREGHRFNPAKLLIDPYARAIDRRLALHPSMFGNHPGAPRDDESRNDIDSGPFVPKGIILGRGAQAGVIQSLTPWPRTVLYELHVRGFTAAHPGIPESMRGRFAALAHEAAIDHLVRLGITTVEIMPSAAWIEERHLAARGLRNYWGYNPIAFMAPDPGLAPGGWDEVRAATDALRAAGIEVILDVVLNHTGEGDALGPTLSLRGLDNATYYRSLPGSPWRYADDAGCGNAIALDRPAPLRMAMDALRIWAVRAGVHGFRFDLATTLGRRDDGFDPAAPLLSAIAQDPVLRHLKLIAEPWDVGLGGYRLGAFPALWGEWNDRFRDDVRLFWRGDPGRLGALATRLAGSADLLAARRVASRSVNFVVAHDGFTLADLVSYTKKDNAANGEGNRDGTDENFSWNNGIEGTSEDAAVLGARARDQRALLATLLLARGTPMLAMGSEFGQSQGGNNNAYAQDNPTAWLHWAAADPELLAWTRELLRIRRDHPVLRDDGFLTGKPFHESSLSDVEWRDAAGALMTPESWQARDGALLVMVLAGPAKTENGVERLSVILHRGVLDIEVTLPPAQTGHAWHLIADSSVGADAAALRSHDDSIRELLVPPTALARPDDASDRAGAINHSAEVTVADPIQTLTVAARSVLVLVERWRGLHNGSAADPMLLGRLTDAAGIAPEWWDVEGRHTIVSDDTRRALLAAMRLPAGSAGEVRDTLRHLSESRDRRALPRTLVTRVGEAGVLRLGLDHARDRRRVWLSVEREDGATERISFSASDGDVTSFTGLDGLPARAWRVKLPELAEGRHRIRREDAPDCVCDLTVAPRRCFLPDSILGGARRFGISAQLYALRRDDDQGIGDFTTLAMLAGAAGREGAATIGINPLHMLFPDQRERASPYHPSDRRFFDPIYLDVADGGADPGLDGGRGITADQRAQFAAASRHDLVAYTEVWALKRAILERRFAAFNALETADAPAAAEFRQFISEGGHELRRFAAFQAIAETRPGESWRDWPEGLRSSDSDGVTAFARAHADRVKFHQYLQFLADRQFAAAAAKAAASGLELGLYRDLAVGAAPDGAESWARSKDLAWGAWVGAPPDPFAVEGQNWYLQPPIPPSFTQTGLAPFAALVAANMRHAGALRIDHAMGLTRLYWIPDGGTGADGAYVAYPFEDLLGSLALESVRAHCMVVGEDLGTVPDGFRARMTEADILSYRVLFLEREGRGFRATSSYPARSVACVTTHDLPPLAGWWGGDDVRERATLGLLRSERETNDDRTLEREALVRALVDEGCLARPEAGDVPVDQVMVGAHQFVASTPGDLMLVQADDLAGMRIGVNLPGTDTERPNWRLRLPVPVEALFGGTTARTILDPMRGNGRATSAAVGDVDADTDPTRIRPVLPDP